MTWAQDLQEVKGKAGHRGLENKPGRVGGTHMDT